MIIAAGSTHRARLNETPPQLILHCELVQAFQLSIAPKGSYITLTDWWGLRGDRTVIVHRILARSFGGTRLTT